ncbi:MAG: cytochrome c family protein [Geminicoccaceae bacterium]|nr:cytochrome c family protein [Geminicoccaceae bacterium]MCB9945702.1 cytochrome c family protein [Geminicoccaceae bacterium]
MSSSLEGNKVLAAILTAGIMASGAGAIASMIYGGHELEEPAYMVEATEGGAAAADNGGGEQQVAELVVPDDGDVAAGEKYAKKCAACHSFDSGGPNKVGPNLFGVVDRPIASHEGFSYSGALADHGGDWTRDNLIHFLHKPKDWAPGTKMTFAGVGKEKDLADLLAYLESLH